MSVMKLSCACAIAMFAHHVLGAEELVKPRPITTAEMKIVRAAMEEKLKDAESAKYKDVMVVDKAIGETCGQVNAKNSYGAYQGYKWFLGMLVGKDGAGYTDGMVLQIDSEGAIAQTMCRQKGMAP